MAAGCWSLAFAGIAIGARAAEDQFLEPEKAFRLSVRAADERHVEVLFQITPNYYMYRERFEVKSPDATLGAVVMPQGKVKFDETFQKDVETYRNELRVRVPVDKAPARFSLHVVSQGCADAGLCYPPMTSAAQISLTAFGGDGSARVTAANVDASPAAGVALSAGGSSTAGAVTPPTHTASSWFDGSAVDSVLQSGRFWLIVGRVLRDGRGAVVHALRAADAADPVVDHRRLAAGRCRVARPCALAASYSLGMALVYAGLGVAAGLAGEGLAARAADRRRCWRCSPRCWRCLRCRCSTSTSCVCRRPGRRA